ncbi:MAG TPA: putative porin [Candidatus Acidoferrales bacterium]|nr:putative porin [Candidatus Acidoferrales bacterium]
MPTHSVHRSTRVATASLAALLAMPPAMAARSGDGSAASARDNFPAESRPAGAAPAESTVPGEYSEIFTELLQLKKAVEAQTNALAERSRELEAELESLREEADRLADLEARLGTALDAQGIVAASRLRDAVSTSSIPQASQTQVPQDWSNRVSSIEDRLKKFGPFIVSGDFRLREEPFLGGPADHSLDRTRTRYRLRFNIDTNLDQDFSGGFSLASGDINDPTSTNQNVDGFYARKPFFIDKAFINFTPHQFSRLTLIGGKFGYPWYNTELTWDKDLNPEGLAQTLVFQPDTPLLKRIAFVGFELPFAHVARTAATNKSTVQSLTYGGQVQTQWQLASWLKFGVYSGFYNFHHADPIALALAKASANNAATAMAGVLPLGTGDTVQNSIVTTTATNIVTIGGAAYPTGTTTVTNAQFASKFALLDSIARVDVTTPSEKWPITFIGNFVQNTGACSNLPNIVAPPANTSSIQFKQSVNFACNARQRHGYWAEAQFGRAQKKGDWQFDYARIFIEREAVLSNFDYSELRQGSNVTEHRASVSYQADGNVQLSFIGLIGRPLNFGSTKPPEPWLERLQFDVLYSF